MYLQMARRVLFETDKRLLWKLAWNMGFKGMLSVEKHKRRLKKGEVFPPFLYVSIINSCNLRCQGCWVDVAAKQESSSPRRFTSWSAKLRNEQRSFGMSAGEVHASAFARHAGQHPDTNTDLTNGQLSRTNAPSMRQLGNVTPLISVEGNEISATNAAPARCLEPNDAGIRIAWRTGSPAFARAFTKPISRRHSRRLDHLIDMGVMYTWFHIYRPMGPGARPELC